MVSLRLLLSLLFIATSIHSSNTVVIYVNGTHGNDTKSCLYEEEDQPCGTLDYALESAAASNYDEQHVSIILSAPGNSVYYYYNLTYQFELNYRRNGITIIGQPHAYIYCTSDDDDDDTGFSFIYSSNIYFSNLTLLGCGVTHNSTSNSGSYDPSLMFLPFKAAIYFLFCSNVTFENVTISNSNGVGIALYSTVGTNIIRNSTFINNRALFGEPGGGGIVIEFLYCIPDDNCSNKIYTNYTNGLETNASYMIDSCHFMLNRANISDSLFIIPRAADNVQLGRGGGLSIVYKGSVNNIPISIINCVFTNNTAIWGGGLLVEFQDESYSNLVTIESTLFIDNICHYSSCEYQGTGGGGVRVLFAGIGHRIYNNTIVFIKCNFTNNRAYFGGGLSFLTFRENTTQLSNSISFDTCIWESNIARLGSAVDITLWHLEPNNDGSVITKPKFTNCAFKSNSIKYTNYTSTPAGIGTVYIDSVPVQFQYNTQFINNDGSALVSLDAPIEFDTNSWTLFNGNDGRVGGGIALFNKAFLLLNYNTSLKFIQNDAFLHGGGLYWENIGDHQLISSRNCFVRYSDSNIDPSLWPVSLTFQDNVANLSGHAIYATTILGCIWGGQSHGKSINPKVESLIDSVFCWNESIWNYNNDSCNDTNIISTAPAYYADDRGNVQCLHSFDTSVIPGKPEVLPIHMLDDRLKQVPDNSLIFSIYRNSSYHSITQYITYENLTYLGSPYLDNGTVELHLKTTSPRVVSTKIELTFNECPPGFVISLNRLICESANYPNIRIGSNYKSYIEFGYWMGHTNNKQDGLMVGQCLNCPLNPDLNHTSYIKLPQSPDDLNEYFCGGLHRTGITCSQCINNYSVAVNSKDFKCVQCSSHAFYYSWFLYILSEYIPLMIMLIIVIIFNISVTSGPANAFIFFAQVISTTFGIDANGIIDYTSVSRSASFFKQVYNSIYGFWNLDFFNAINLEDWLFCLGPNVNSLHIMMLKFVSAFFPLLVIGCVLILLHFYHNNYRCIVFILQPLHKLTARCFRWLNFQRSLMDAFGTFIILSYVKFSVTSCQLLYPNMLVNATGHMHTVSLFNGEIEFISLQYAPYLITSSVVLFFCTLLPFLLLLYSTRPCYTCLERLQWRRLQPGDKAQQFLDSFHQCFKDGRDGEHDRRYYAALYFFFKLFLIATFAFGLSWTIQYVCQQFICTVALLTLGILQPYKNMLYNILDLAMFSILSAINVITLYNYYIQAINSPISAVSYWLLLLLIFTPLVYFVVYISYFLYRAIKSKCCQKSRRMTLEEQQERDLDNFSFSTFMDTVNKEDRFTQNNYYGSVIPDGEMMSFVENNNNDIDPSHVTINRTDRSTNNKTDISKEPLLQSTEYEEL